ncbi:CBM35 domain-containing protein [Streptomyces sp. NPDC002054]|uniref:CBM35 domain-containing protein n=1 Tax=Streptomyces sp. NPDC002054 TaxID=3154663 RepID=UPI00331B566D
MTTPANKPEDDDPFGYLYADGQAAGAAPPPPGGGYGYPGPTVGGQPGVQPGVPRTSYNQVRTVGERTYGGQRGAVPPQAQPQPHYAAPEAIQAGGYGVPPQAPPPQHTQPIPSRGGHGGGGGGSSRRGLLIAAVAVVAAVAIGIGAAVTFGKDGKDKKDGTGTQAGGGQTQSAPPQNSASPEPSTSKSSAPTLPKGDAGGPGMAIAGGAQLQSTVPGAKSEGGQYVGNFNQVGASVTWTVDAPKQGEYTFRVFYGVPGKDANATLSINGAAQGRAINMKNFSKAAEGDWAKGWTNTYSYINLKQGTNTIKISCEAGNQCEAIIDQFSLSSR